MPLALGLFHTQEVIRDLTVELLNNLSVHPVSQKAQRFSTLLILDKIGIHFLQNLNHFHRMAYIRLAAARESLRLPIAYPSPPLINGSHLSVPQSTISRSSSNLSSNSLGATTA